MANKVIDEIFEKAQILTDFPKVGYKYENWYFGSLSKILIVNIDNYAYAIPFVENDKEELKLLESLENDEWQSVKNLDQELKEHKKIAKNTIKKIRGLVKNT